MNSITIFDRLQFSTLDKILVERRTDIFEYPEILELTYRDHYKEEVSFYDGLLGEHAEGSKTVLELGAGWGRIAKPLASRGHRVVAVDYSSAMVKALAKEEVAGIDIVCGNMNFPPLLDSSADLVLIPLGILNTIVEIDAITGFFGQVANILKPGGIIAAVVITAPEPEELLPHRVSWRSDSQCILTETEFKLTRGNHSSPDIVDSIHRVRVRTTQEAKPTNWRYRTACLEWRCPVRIYTPRLVEQTIASAGLKIKSWHRMFDLANSIASPVPHDGSSVLLLEKETAIQ